MPEPPPTRPQRHTPESRYLTGVEKLRNRMGELAIGLSKGYFRL